MNMWVQRALRTTLLTGGFLAVGTGIAAADENDLTADLLGITVTVPVGDAAVLPLPVVTGTGGDLTVGTGAGDGIALPVNTNTTPGTTVLGSDGAGGVSGPVTVTEADGSPPDPQDGLTVTLPVNTSGGGSAGTTITVPIVTGNLGDVLDGDPLTGNDIDANLDNVLVTEQDGSALVFDAEDLITIGNTDGSTTPDTVLEVPVGIEQNPPATVTLPLPHGGDAGRPLTGNDVDVRLGQPIGDGNAPAPGAPAGDSDPTVSLPISTGDVLPDVTGGDALTGNTIDIHVGDLLGLAGSGTGSVVTVPVNQDGSGTGSDNLVQITLPLDLSGLLDPGQIPGQIPGPGDGSGDGSSDGSGDGSGNGTGDGSGNGTGDGTGDSSGGDSGGGSTPGSGSGPGSPVGDSTGTGSGGGSGSGTQDGDARALGSVGDGAPVAGDGSQAGGRDACGTGDGSAMVTRSASTVDATGTPVLAMAGMLALGAGLLLVLGRGRLWGNRAKS